METSEISTDSVSLSCVFMAEAARPVGRAWSWEVARVMGVAGGTPGSGPITRCRVLSRNDTMERTWDTCHGESHTCKCCLCQGFNLQDGLLPRLATPAGNLSKMQAKHAANAAIRLSYNACCQPAGQLEFAGSSYGACHTCIPTIASAVLRLVAPGAAGREKIFWDTSALMADTLASGTREKAGTPLVGLRRKALRPSCQRPGPMLLRLLLPALSLCEASMESRVKVPGFSMPCQDRESNVWNGGKEHFGLIEGNLCFPVLPGINTSMAYKQHMHQSG